MESYFLHVLLVQCQLLEITKNYAVIESLDLNETFLAKYLQSENAYFCSEKSLFLKLFLFPCNCYCVVLTGSTKNKYLLFLSLASKLALFL